MPKLQLGDDVYRIVGDGGEEGELVEYGDPATLEVGGHRYLAIVDVDPTDDQNVISLLAEGEWIVDGRSVGDVEMEDVEFKTADGAGEGDEGEETVTATADDDDDDDLDLDLDDDEDDDFDEDEEEDEDDQDDDGDNDPFAAVDDEELVIR
jgi:hypothetical protein